MNSYSHVGKMLNPTSARFLKEGKRLYVGVPLVYMTFARLVAICGLGMIVIGLLGGLGVVVGSFGAAWWEFFGFLIFVSAAVSIYKFDFVDFNLKEKTFRRRCGLRNKRRIYNGKLSEVDAIVLTKESNYMGGFGPSAFYLRLHWKDGSELPTTMMEIMIDGMASIQAHEIVQGYAPFAYIKGLESGQAFASALETRFFNSTGLPLPPLAPGSQYQPVHHQPGYPRGGQPVNPQGSHRPVPPHQNPGFPPKWP